MLFGRQLKVLSSRLGSPGGKLETSQVALEVKNLPAIAGDVRDMGLFPESRSFPWRRKWQPTPVFLPGASHGQRGLIGYSPRGCKESGVTKQLTLHY